MCLMRIAVVSGLAMTAATFSAGAAPALPEVGANRIDAGTIVRVVQLNPRQINEGRGGDYTRSPRSFGEGRRGDYGKIGTKGKKKEAKRQSLQRR
jgi:hypothetical protein